MDPTAPSARSSYRTLGQLKVGSRFRFAPGEVQCDCEFTVLDPKPPFNIGSPERLGVKTTKCRHYGSEQGFMIWFPSRRVISTPLIDALKRLES